MMESEAEDEHDELKFKLQASTKVKRPKTGAELIAEERQRQCAEEGWTPEHDAQHEEGELIRAALCYADCAPLTKYVGPHTWPWAPLFDKRVQHSKKRRLVIAGALIAAELDRLQAEEAEDGA